MSATRMTVGEVRDSLGDVLNRVAFTGEVIIVTRHGKDVVRIVAASGKNSVHETSPSPEKSE